MDDNDESDSDEDALILQKGPNKHDAQAKATAFSEVQELADVQIDAEDKTVQEGRELLRRKHQDDGVYDCKLTSHGTTEEETARALRPPGQWGL